MRLIERSTHLVIRFSRRGCTNRPFYHIVVMKNRQPQLKKVKDQIGTYDPLPNIHNERVMSMDFDKLRKWVACGAVPSKPVSQLLGLAGYFPIHPTTRLEAFRKHRKSDVAAEQENESSQTAQSSVS